MSGGQETAMTANVLDDADTQSIAECLVKFIFLKTNQNKSSNKGSR